MVEALSLIKLKNRIRERYDYDEQRVVGIILARYDIRITKEIVDQCYQYWNLNSRKYFDVFWAGYEHIYLRLRNLRPKPYSNIGETKNECISI